jgi:hypothetical protein
MLKHSQADLMRLAGITKALRQGGAGADVTARFMIGDEIVVTAVTILVAVKVDILVECKTEV